MREDRHLLVKPAPERRVAAEAALEQGRAAVNEKAQRLQEAGRDAAQPVLDGSKPVTLDRRRQSLEAERQQVRIAEHVTGLAVPPVRVGGIGS